MEWSWEWPRENGYYWLYGWCFSNHDDPPRFYYVKVRRTGNGWAYIADGHFIYKAEGAYGVWQPVEFPERPAD